MIKKSINLIALIKNNNLNILSFGRDFLVIISEKIIETN